ncbi:MAG: reverse transcriptase domain-containing protein [Isosphaeraceae bacterium]
MSGAVQEIQRFLHQQARRQPSRPFDRLMRFVTDWTVIEEAWRRVRGSHGANTPGADRLVARDLEPDSVATRVFLQDIADALQSGAYRPGPVRRFDIVKPDHSGETRPLAILVLADRVVHMALKLVLEPIIEARLGKRCFGFRPGRSRYDQLQAVRRLVVTHPEEFTAALTADVASCFDELDHRLILEDVQGVVADPHFLGLFGSMLDQVGTGRAGWWHRRPVGVLQGSPISPLLANWNLTRFDNAWHQRHGDRAPMFRYADDLLILARNPVEAAGLRRPLARCLHRATHLRLAPRKTRVVTLEQGVPLLGLLIRRHFDVFDGREDVHVFIDPEPFRQVLGEIDEWVEHLDADRPLGRQFARFNERLRGWFETYQYAYDAPQAFESLDRHLFATVRRRLKELLGASAATLDRDHHCRLKSGHDTWEADGVPLLPLGALPRKHYRPARVRPPWESDPEPSPNSPRTKDDGVVSKASRLTGLARLDPMLVAIADGADPAPSPSLVAGGSENAAGPNGGAGAGTTPAIDDVGPGSDGPKPSLDGPAVTPDDSGDGPSRSS